MKNGKSVLSGLLGLLSLVLISCYPAYQATPRLNLVVANPENRLPPDIAGKLRENMQLCFEKLDGKRKEIHDEKKLKYYGTLVSNLFAYGTGAGAGVTGYQEEKALSATFGGLSLISGVIGTIIQTNGKEKSQEETKLLFAKWGRLIDAKTDLEITTVNFTPSEEGSQEKLKKAVAEFIKAVNEFGVSINDQEFQNLFSSYLN